MQNAATNKLEIAAATLQRDVLALFHFLYGTEKRSRTTILASLALYGYCVIAASLDNLAQVQGACGL